MQIALLFYRSLVTMFSDKKVIISAQKEMKTLIAHLLLCTDLQNQPHGLSTVVSIDSQASKSHDDLCLGEIFVGRASEIT